MGLAAEHWLVILLLLALQSPDTTSRQSPCPFAETPPGLLVSRVGGRVDVSCGLEGGAERAVWMFNGRPLRGRATNGSRLSLSGVRGKDTGSYACLRNGTRVLQFRLLVTDCLKVPSISCLVKSYLSPIRCEWQSKELKRLTRCILSYRTSLQQNATLRPCKFYTGRQVCVCTVPHTEGEHEHYFIALTVSNGIDCVTSKERMFSFDRLLRSDPPQMVRVRSVRGAAHKLNVTWAYPVTWQQGFYALKFKVTYGVKGELFFKTVTIKDTFFLIADALPDKNYTVQVCAREEFDHGSWSEWSAEEFGVPWADPERNRVVDTETEGLPSTDIECEACPLEEKILQESHYPQRNVFPNYVLWLVVTSLLSVTVLFIAILLRYRKKWKSHAKVQAEIHLGIKLIGRPRAQQDPKENEATAESLLQGVSGSPASEGDVGSQPQGEDPPFEVMNPSYFFIHH